MPSPLVVLAEPKEIFRDIEERAPWLAPFAYSAFAFFLITWLGGCWTDIKEGLRWSSLIGPAIASGLVVSAMSVGSTGLLILLLWIMGAHRQGESRFRMLFSLNLHCGIILVLGEVVNFLLMHSGFALSIDVPLPNRFPLGPDLLLLAAKERNIYVAILLHSASAFVVWYLVILARGLKGVAELSTVRAVAATCVLWLVGVATILGVVYHTGGGTVFRVAV